jgi:hypothetical protein
VAKAQITGAAVVHPERHRDRIEPAAGRTLGAAPDWFDGNQAAVWEGFKRELPWLTEADRAVVEIAATLRSQFKANPAEFGATKLNLLRLALAQMGATPADRSKITVPDGDEQDPDDEFYN